MKNKNLRRQSGFTMVELLIAIIIIGILVAIIVPVLSNRASDARIAAAKADLEAIANANPKSPLIPVILLVCTCWMIPALLAITLGLIGSNDVLIPYATSSLTMQLLILALYFSMRKPAW